ncbi:aldo/keto reductase, partial [Amycolatopsis lurida]
LAAAGISAITAGLGQPVAAARGGTAPVTRPLPNSDERVPVIGLGTFMTFDRRPETDQGFIPRVLRAFYDGGGRVIDTAATYGAAETNTGHHVHTLGLTDKVFFTDKSWNCGNHLFDDSHALRQFDQARQRLHRGQLDVVAIHSMTNVGMILPVLNQLKAQGAIR